MPIQLITLKLYHIMTVILSIYQQHSYKRVYLQRFFVNVKGEGDDFALGVQANFKRKIHHKMSSNGS